MRIKRLEYVDQIRGLAILLVVIGHLIQTNDSLYARNPLLNFIYSFHMPLFFAISGYITAKTSCISKLKEYLFFVKKKFYALCIPLLFWTLIVNKFFLQILWLKISLNDLNNVIFHPGLWFLKTLFIILIIYGIYDWSSNIINFKKDILNIFKDIILFVIVTLLYGLMAYLKIENINSVMYAGIFYLGVFISKYEIIKTIILSDKVFSIFFITFLVLVTHWKFINNGSHLYDIEKVMISSSIFITLLNITIKGQWENFLSKSLSLFGRYSLAIYVTHWCILDIGYNFTVLNNLNPFILFLLSTIIAAIICYFCCFFAKIIQVSKILSFLFYGKSSK